MAVEGKNVHNQGISDTNNVLEIMCFCWNNLEVAGFYPFLKSYCPPKKAKNWKMTFSAGAITF